MKTETSKTLLEYKLLSLIKLKKKKKKTVVFVTSLKIKHCLKSYNITSKNIFETKRLQDFVRREGLQDYKGRMITRVFLEGEGESYILSRVGT